MRYDAPSVSGGACPGALGLNGMAVMNSNGLKLLPPSALPSSGMSVGGPDIGPERKSKLCCRGCLSSCALAGNAYTRKGL